MRRKGPIPTDGRLTHLDQEGVTIPVLRMASIPKGGIFPIQVQAVELVLPEELHGAADEFLPVFPGAHQGREPGRE